MEGTALEEDFTMSERIVIVGANHAGTACANQILAAKPDAELLIIDRNNNISFLGCGMALWIGSQISTGDGLFYCQPEIFREKGAKVRMETEVISVDYERRILSCRDKKTGAVDEIPFDKLVLATGSSPVRPPIPGIELENIQHAKLFQDAKKAVEQLQNDEHIKRVCVVGAGYIGAELAEAYQRRGKQVTLIDTLDRILGTHFDKDFSDQMAERLQQNGIELRLNERVTAFEGEGKVETVVTDKGRVETDLVLFCIGFRPNSELGVGKLELFRNGAFQVNLNQETSVPGVYAIGDCATVYDNSLQATSYIALATNAVRSGIVAALNICGLKAESLGVQGSSGLCLYDLKMVCTGQSMYSAEQAGIKAKSVDFRDLQKPAFMNEAGENPEVQIRIVYREDNHEVIGAQLMSEYDMSAVIHMFSLAIQERVTIERIALLDIFFMPHFNQPYNYITMAAISAQ